MTASADFKHRSNDDSNYKNMSPTVGPREKKSGGESRDDSRVLFFLFVPAVVVVVILLIIPLGWLIWQSFFNAGSFDLENYRRVFSGPYRDTFLLTFQISAIVTILVLLLAYPVAYIATTCTPKWRTAILALVILPFWTSTLVRTYAWLVLLQRTGLVNKGLLALGVIDTPLQLAYNQLGTTVAMVHVLLPFAVLPLFSAMQKIPSNILLAGSSLGGSRFYVFRRVFFPLTMGGVLAGTTLVFVLCLGFYTTPALMGGGKTVMVSMLVGRNIEIYTSWGAASSVCAVLLTFVFAIFYAANKLIPLEKILGTK